MTLYWCLLLTILLVANAQDNNELKTKPACCSQEEAEDLVLQNQKEVFFSLRECDFNTIQSELATKNATYNAILRCSNSSKCCISNGPLGQWWKFYSCYMKIEWPEKSINLKWLKNGTAVFSYNELSALHLSSSSIVVRSLENSLYWSPVCGELCEYRLTYVRTHDIRCPAVVSMPCSQCS